MSFIHSKIIKSEFTCEDDVYSDCERRVANGGCHGACGDTDPHTEARKTLAECRQSCREFYKDWAEEDLPEMIKLYGGLEDSVNDLFGFKYDLCDPNMGFTSSGRKDVLFHCASFNQTKKWVPGFTELGFEKTKIPPHLYHLILKEYEILRKHLVHHEPCLEGVINCQKIFEKDGKCYTAENSQIFIMNLSPGVLEMLKVGLQPMAEKWANVKLEHTATYGIRRYTNGSWLISHIDRFTTHVISAILNIGQNVDKDWELHILDNQGHPHQVVLEPGDMVWYESARLLHGRPDKFVGEYFDNLFIHYKPTHLWYDRQVEFDKNPRETPITLDDIKRAQNV